MKCDETHPICLNCERHNFECDFTPSREKLFPVALPPVRIPPVRIPRQRRLHDSFHCSPGSTLTPSSPSTATLLRRADVTSSRYQPKDSEEISVAQNQNGFSLPAHMDTPFDRLLEHRLMHHFVSMSAQTYFRLIGTGLVGQATDQLASKRNIYVDWVVRLSLTNEHLMDALLGFSAFSLRNLDSTNRKLSQASHAYMTRAISAHVADLNRGIGDSNGETAFATACLIAFTTISSKQYISSNEDVGLPLHWFKPWQGVRAVATASWNHLSHGDFKTLLEHERTNQIPPKLDHDKVPVFDFLLQDLDRETTDPEAVHAYDLSVLWLTRMYHNPRSEYVFKFTTKVPPKFVELLEAKDPRTLTIVGYFFMLLRILDKVWWLPQMTRGQFWTLVDMLPGEGMWKARMEWAAKEFETSEGAEPRDMSSFGIGLKLPMT
ncbi:hypothetical protein LZ554_001535 [Drepanopeziza brunnea f. sp. 'monogermtubi']|nr:hypothetical protein LZ554_001535 [Drepanopeziza brunnea f. sp. 'monogermtubi']